MNLFKGGAVGEDGQCDECGRFFAVGMLVCAQCKKCDSAIVVCKDHGIQPTCLRCGYSVKCAVCGVLVKERCTNSVLCTECEGEIGVCDKDVADPVCRVCVGSV